MTGAGDRGPTLKLEVASLTPEGSAWIVVESGPGAGGSVVIRDVPIVIGSDPGCDLVIDDPHVSRRHAEISRSDRGIVLRDLGSRNGTLVGQLAVQEVTLPSGVEIRVGTSGLRFEQGGQAGQLARLARAPLRDDELAKVAPRFGPAIGAAPAMRRLFAQLGRLAPTDLTITLIGETGTGKDVLARAIHLNSARAAHPFVVFDCGAVAPSLIESELFGHEKGSFTGAVAERRGAFERAHRGTLFLDEIGELPLELQPKLLRALEQRSAQPRTAAGDAGAAGQGVRRVGGADDLAVDVRIVAATNRDLEDQVRKRAFREDLFFRLMVALVHVPALRERRSDLEALATAFLAEAGRPLQLAPATLQVLANYEWPGNVRELRNVIASAAAMAEGDTLEPTHLAFFRPQRRQAKSRAHPVAVAGQTLEQLEKAAIADALQRADGNRTKAAKALGIAPSTLYDKIRRYGLKPPEPEPG
jgi:DNA-binding NtrC family response regulator